MYLFFRSYESEIKDESFNESSKDVKQAVVTSENKACAPKLGKYENTQNVQHSLKLKEIRKTTKLSFTDPYFCDICFKKFTRKNDLQRHHIKIHKDAKILADVQAKKTESELKSKLLQTCKVLTDNGEYYYKCEVCKLNFHIPYNFVRHQEVHKDNEKHRRIRRPKSELICNFPCDLCSKKFTRKNDLQKHRKQIHKDAPEILDKRKILLERNSQLLQKCKIHTEDGKECFKCEICKKIFNIRFNFIRHQTIHNDCDENFKDKNVCEICGKIFNALSGLKRHIKEFHNKIKERSCELCGKNFANKSVLNEHMNIHTNKRPFFCEICGKSFKQKSALYTHNLFHSNEFKFSCTICGKKYRRARALKIHSWLHTGDRPYSCDICGNTFRLIQTLKKHKKIHNISEFNCSQCNAYFPQERYLRKHLKTQHAVQ